MPRPSRALRRASVLLAAALVGACATSGAPAAPEPPRGGVARQEGERIERYRPRFGRTRPVIAVVGVNSGVELTDYVIPYGVLRRADVGEVVAVATGPGPMRMRPALRIQPQATVAEFDARFPDGADYVVTPAVVQRKDPVLLGWLRAQAAKGATLVSICDGALVLADAGLLDGRRATAHWATVGYRRKTYPAVRWVDDRRYVADGKVISSAGISAAIPTSIALVEAIAGRARAVEVAKQIGVTDWSPAHDSRRFQPRLGRNLSAFAVTQGLNGWLHKPQSIGIPVGPGEDEVALALEADAYARTGRAHAYAVAPSAAPVTTLHGLALLPDRTDAASLDHMAAAPTGPSALTLDRTLADISRLYGRLTAFGVALDFEYPGFHG